MDAQILYILGGGANSNAGELNLPNLIGTLGAFKNCKGLTTVISLGSITEIASEAFSGCSNLTYVNIPQSCTKIKSNAFRQCGLTGDLILSDNIEELANDAIRQCSNLTSIVIGTGIKVLGDRAIYQCYNLASITIKATTPPTRGDGSLDLYNCPIYVPASSVSAYQTAWSDIASRIQAIPTT